MRRRGSIVLATVALSTLACGQAATSTEPLPTSPASDTPTASGVSVPPSAPDPTARPQDSQGPDHGTWRAAASMGRERHGFDAVLLDDGTVLVVGSDWDCQPGPAVPGSETAEVYDPEADRWTEIDSLNKPRKEPATVGADGRALVLGGVNSDDVPFSSTKILDAATLAWTDGPLLQYARARPNAVRLDDGRILVVSEDGPRDSITTAELSDRSLTRWSLVRALPALVRVEDLVALHDGRTLAIGLHHRDSDPAPATFVYDAARDTWTETEGLARFGATFVALPDGTVLAIGGAGGGELWGDTRAAIEDVARFDPATGRWRPVAPMISPRHGLQAAVLTDGRVLVAGGTTEGASGEQVLRSTELYDPAIDTWTSTGTMRDARHGGRLVALDDGSALILGGTAEYNVYGDTPFCPQRLTTAERFWP